MGKIIDRAELRGGATVGGTEVIDADGNITADIKDTLASGKIYVGNASGISAEVAVSGDATLANTGALTVGTTAVTGKVLTGFVQGAGVVAATDSILEGVNKLDGNVAALSAAGVGGTLADTLVIVGNGTNVATAVAVSGDATIANTGALTVTGSTGAFAVGTTFGTASTTVTSGAGAVAITGAIHEITTTGTGDAMTLADGAEGQHLHVVYVAEGAGGDTAVLTPSNLAGANTTVTFTDLGDSAHLLFTAGTWFFLGGEATVA